jgi:glycosyltransferase involved in cell wall biosynthesis
MTDLIYLCAQPATYYYSWQVDAMLLSFQKYGEMDLTKCHIVCAVQGGGIDPWFQKVADKWKKLGVGFYWYKDDRKKPRYISSVRPHILEKHWSANPWLETKAVMYHDCDIAFSKPLKVDDKLDESQDKECFLSDTRTYIGPHYLDGFKNNLTEDMCAIVDIPVELVRAKEAESGGAQYMLKPGIDAKYWRDVFVDSERLFEEISQKVNKIKKDDPDWHPLQIWCADMWAVLWNLWKRGYTTPITIDFEFTWGTQPIEMWDKHAIFHNAGVVTNPKDGAPFYKALYMKSSPYLAPDVDKKWASHNYLELIKESYRATEIDAGTMGLGYNDGISFMVPTWKRTHLLEEALESFLRQTNENCEMVIINDDESIKYEFDHPRVKVHNVPKFERFMDKLKFGFDQCQFNHMYRLDDDDLLLKNACDIVLRQTKAKPNMDLYAAAQHWYVGVSQIRENGLGNAVNTGNTFSKNFIEWLDWDKAPEPPGEDQWMVYYPDIRNHEFDEVTMIYRWGVSPAHLTHKPHNKTMQEFHDSVEQWKVTEKGTNIHVLQPHFTRDWYDADFLTGGPMNIDDVKPDPANVWFYWDGNCEGERLQQLYDSLISTRYFNPERPIYLVSNTFDQLPIFDEHNITVVRWGDSIYRHMPNGEAWKPLYNAASARDRCDLLRFLFLKGWAGSYIDSDDMAVRPLPPVHVKNIVCRSYDPHTCHYDGLKPEDCLPGHLRGKPQFDHIPIFPRTDIWLNHHLDSPIVRGLLHRPEHKPEQGINTIYSHANGGGVGWQTMILRTCEDNIATHGKEWHLDMTLLYLFESHVANCSVWDQGKHGGEMHQIYPKGQGNWGSQEYPRQQAVQFLYKCLEEFPGATHLWLHDKGDGISAQWHYDYNQEWALLSTHWIQHIRKVAGIPSIHV